MLDIPKFENKADLFAFLIDKKSDLLAQKMNTIKFADGVDVSLESDLSMTWDKEKQHFVMDTECMAINHVIEVFKSLGVK